MSRQGYDYRMSFRKGWAACPGAVALAARHNIASTETDDAEEGTLAHAYLEAWLLWYKNGCNDIDAALKERAAEKLDKEGRAAVQVCIDHVLELLDAYPDAELHLEQRVQIDVEFVTARTCGGTLDIHIWVPSLSIVYVIDYKHGAGRLVEHLNNEQLRGYGVCASTLYPAQEYVLQIVQPRHWHREGVIRSEVVSATDMRIEYEIMVGQIARCEAEPTTYAPYDGGNTDDNYCRYCPAAIVCPALEAKALAVTGTAEIRTLTERHLPAPADIPFDRLSFILQAAPTLKGWLKSVEEYAANLAYQGYHIPGFKLIESQTRRVLAKPEHEVIEEMMMLTGLSIDEIAPRSLPGIVELENMLAETWRKHAPRGKKREAAADARRVFAWFTTKTGSGVPKLVPLSDKRPAWDARVHTHFAAVQLPPPEGDDE